jgi:hypothetical protein
MKQHIITHKQDKKQYLLNTVEMTEFFKKQDVVNYTIKDKLTKQEIIGNIISFVIVSICSVGLLILGALLDRL